MRAGAPQARIVVDANEGWTAEAYAALAPALVALGVEMVEQPLPAGDDAALADMPRPLPVCADESCHDRASLAALAGRYDMVNIKLDKTGGLTEALALRDAARGGGLRRHGRLHGRLQPRDGAGGARRAGRRGRRPRRPAAARPRPRPSRCATTTGASIRRRPSSGGEMSRTVYVNGDWLPEEEATISVFDRGFLFADGVYEVTSVLDGRLVDFAGHLARLHRSLDALEMPAPVADDALLAIHREIVARNAVAEGMVYLQVTRGAADRDFAWPAAPTPSLVLFTQARPLVDSAAARDGIRVITVPDIRWGRRDIKTVQLLAPSMAKMAARKAGDDDAWMVEDGLVTEGDAPATPRSSPPTAGSSPAACRPRSCTASPAPRCCAWPRQAQLRVEERAFSVAEAAEAAEAFVTAASAFVTPVVEIDGRPLGDGRPGPVTRRLRETYIAEARRDGDLGAQGPHRARHSTGQSPGATPAQSSSPASHTSAKPSPVQAQRLASPQSPTPRPRSTASIPSPSSASAGPVSTAGSRVAPPRHVEHRRRQPVRPLDPEAVGPVVGAREVAGPPERRAAAEVEGHRLDARRSSHPPTPRPPPATPAPGRAPGSAAPPPPAPPARAATLAAGSSPGRASAVTVPIRHCRSSIISIAAVAPRSDTVDRLGLARARAPAGRRRASPGSAPPRSAAGTAARTQAPSASAGSSSGSNGSLPSTATRIVVPRAPRDRPAPARPPAPPPPRPPAAPRT